MVVPDTKSSAAAYWTLMQTLAWIITRDQRVVQRTSPNKVEARKADAELRLFSADLTEECFGDAACQGVTDTGLVMWKAAVDHSPDLGVDAFDVAEQASDLLSDALRRGHLLARGLHPESARMVDIAFDEWTLAILIIERLGTGDTIEVRRSNEHGSASSVTWPVSNVLVSATVTKALWPPLDATLLPKKHLGGRPKHAALLRIRPKALQWLFENGSPEEGDLHEFRTHLLDLLPSGDEPAPETIRRFMRDCIKERNRRESGN